MKIAILGWGSLVWQPKELKYDKSFGWEKDGPVLPIEFARISKDGRLTLVITVNGTKVPTLYTLSEYTTIDEAVLDIAVREGSGRNSIGSYDKIKNKFFPKDFICEYEIREWIGTRDLEGVIWTGLTESWKIKNENRDVIKSINSDDRIDYLKNLPKPTLALA